MQVCLPGKVCRLGKLQSRPISFSSKRFGHEYSLAKCCHNTRLAFFSLIILFLLFTIHCPDRYFDNVARNRYLTKDFIDLISYDVSALFTSFPVNKALEVVENLLKSQDCWKSKTYLNVDQVLSLLGFCLRTTYFTFRGDIYQQDKGCATWDHLFPI